MADPLARIVTRSKPCETIHLAADPADAVEVARLRAAARIDPDGSEAGELADLLERIVTIDVTLEGLSTQLSDVIDEHPPTPTQLATAERQGQRPPQWNVDTFAPALLTATVTSLAFSDDPADLAPLDVGRATTIWQALSDGDRNELLGAALGVCTRSSRVADLGKG